MKHNIEQIKNQIMLHPDNAHKTSQGIKPLMTVVPQSKIIIVGQAPGTKAEKTGLPWNDASGDRLREWLGVGREVFYNAKFFGQLPMDFYYPGKGKHGDLPPRKNFAPMWHKKILDCAKQVELIILVGSYAQNFYLTDKLSLTQRVKNFQNYLPKFFLLVHPSPLNVGWLKRNPWFENQVLPALKQKVYEILKDEKDFYQF